MSHTTIPDAVGWSGAAPDAGPAAPVRDADVVARAREVIAGRVRPPVLATPPDVEAFLRREFADKEPPPTPEAIRRLTEHLTLQAKYADCPVAVFTNADGSLAVVAVGESEIRALLDGLSPEEKSKVMVTDFG